MGRTPYHEEENWIVSGQNLIVLGFVIFGDKIWGSGWTLELTIATVSKVQTRGARVLLLVRSIVITLLTIVQCLVSST